MTQIQFHCLSRLLVICVLNDSKMSRLLSRLLSCLLSCLLSRLLSRLFQFFF
jgi:hypothetical protein